MRLTLRCHDRVYDSWDLHDTETGIIVDKTKYTICPFEQNIFDQDVFDYNGDGTITIIHSTVRDTPMPGVFIFEKNKTYGKCKNKYYYRFVPDNPRLPIFVVPYLIKKVGFNKYF